MGGAAPTQAKADDPIDESEFEALGDELYETGKTAGRDDAPAAACADDAPMSDDEFEALLDSLHTGASTPAAAAPVAAVATTGESGHGTTPLLANAGKPASEGALAVRTAHAPVDRKSTRLNSSH